MFIFLRKQAELEYNELKKQVEHLQMIIEEQRKNPTSEYDESIQKQQQFNETLRTQVISPLAHYCFAINLKRIFIKYQVMLIVINQTIYTIQVADAKDKLKNLSQSLKTLRSCRKDCNIHMRDLIIDYNCITKVL